MKWVRLKTPGLGTAPGASAGCSRPPPARLGQEPNAVVAAVGANAMPPRRLAAPRDRFPAHTMAPLVCLRQHRPDRPPAAHGRWGTWWQPRPPRRSLSGAHERRARSRWGARAVLPLPLLASFARWPAAPDAARRGWCVVREVVPPPPRPIADVGCYWRPRRWWRGMTEASRHGGDPTPSGSVISYPPCFLRRPCGCHHRRRRCRSVSDTAIHPD